MAILKNIINASLSGNVGSMNFRKRGAEVVVAQRSYTNSSKGKGASVKQREHRTKLPNVLAVYNAIAPIQQRAWEFRPSNCSFANMFVKENLVGSPVYLTAAEAKAGAQVMCKYVVSKGSLPTLPSKYEDSKFKTGIVLTEDFDLSNNTIGALSEDISTNNTQLRNGDKISIAFVNMFMMDVAGVVVPRMGVNYFELTLDAASEKPIMSLPNITLLQAANESGELVFAAECNYAFAIHSRLTSGKLLTSTQMAVECKTSTIYAKYTAEAQKQLAMESYGFMPDVLLTPGSVSENSDYKVATVNSVTYDSSDLVNGTKLQAGKELAIIGTDLNRNNVQVVNNGITLVPQSANATKQTYTIGRNGSLIVKVNGSQFAYATIEGAAANVTAVKFDGRTYSVGASNLQFAQNLAATIEVEGENLGELTATGATLTNKAGNENKRTANVNMPAGSSPWTISCGSQVILSGSTAEGGENYE